MQRQAHRHTHTHIFTLAHCTEPHNHWNNTNYIENYIYNEKISEVGHRTRYFLIESGFFGVLLQYILCYNLLRRNILEVRRLLNIHQLRSCLRLLICTALKLSWIVCCIYKVQAQSAYRIYAVYMYSKSEKRRKKTVRF